MNRLVEKVAIVTGGTSGIGEKTAEYFALEGASVVVAGRNLDRGNKVVEGIRKKGGKSVFIFYEADKKESVASLVEKTIEHFGRIDILFNNAGNFASKSLEDTGLEEWKKMFDVNITGYFLLIQSAMPYLEKQKGVILNNASIAGLHSYVSGRTYGYSASKAAVIQLTRSLALNYGQHVRVNCICPGVIETPLLAGRDMNSYAKNIPMRRVGTPEDVAKVAVFLVSEEASYINGAVIPVDGGASL